MSDDEVVAEKVRLYFDTPGGDVVHAEEIYHADAVLEFPQSGERFEGRDAFTEWRSQYPSPVSFELQRVTIRGDVAVIEVTLKYDGSEDESTKFGVALIEFRGDKVARERVYSMDSWDAPEWRRRWRSTPD